MDLSDIVAISAVRTPMGRFGGTIKDVPSYELGAVAIRAAVTSRPPCFPRRWAISAALGRAIRARYTTRHVRPRWAPAPVPPLE